MPEARRDLLLPHLLHLVGDAGHAGDLLAVVLDEPAGRGADRVVDGAGRRDQRRLLDVHLRHRAVPPGVPAAQHFLELWADGHRLAERRRDRLAGQVVLGRAEAAGHDDHVRAVERLLDRSR